MIVQLKRRNRQYPDLTPGRPYVVIGIEAGDYRLLNDRGEPYLFPARLFEVVERRRPRSWQLEHGDEGEEYAYPAPLNQPGFFEDFHDGDPHARATFWQVVNATMAKVTG